LLTALIISVFVTGTLNDPNPPLPPILVFNSIALSHKSTYAAYDPVQILSDKVLYQIMKISPKSPLPLIIGKAGLKGADEERWMALHSAAKAGSLDPVLSLIDAGAHVKATD